MRLALFTVAGLMAVAAGCSEDPLSPKSLAGTYPLTMVNGGAPSAYHPVEAADCQASFPVGSLVIHANGSFRFDLSYYYACAEPSPQDGPGTIIVTGDETRIVDDKLYLDGCGEPVGTVTCPVYTLQLTRMGDEVELEFLSVVAQYWGDPVFTLGPRQ